MKTGYTVADVMTQNVLTASPDEKLQHCAKLMAMKKIGSLVIEDKGAVAGILTEQDLARKVVAQGVDAVRTAVSSFMSRRVVTIAPEEDLYTAMVEMGKHNIKHLPVLKEEKLVGIITFKDIIKIEPALIEKLWAKADEE